MNPQQKPDNYIDAVSIAIVDGDRILLVKRGRQPSKGMYAFPGGRVEAGESLEQAVHRELMEETGSTAGRVEVAEVLQFASSRPDLSGYLLTVFTGALGAGTLQAGDDAAEAGWFTLEQIATMPLTDSTALIAQRLLKAGSALPEPESLAKKEA